MNDPGWLLQPVEKLEEGLDPSKSPTWYMGTREQHAIEYTDQNGRKHTSKHSGVEEAVKEFQKIAKVLLPSEGVELIRYSRMVIARKRAPHKPSQELEDQEEEREA